MWNSLGDVAAAVNTCQDCPLCRGRTRAVPGHGNASARFMLIGEAPGYHEDLQGLPFVGQAGQLLNELLQSIGLKRGDVYITNVVKCRPPQNRDPLTEEMEACAKYLERQIDLINPEIIVTLGRYSMARFLPGDRIAKVHGAERKVNGRTVVPMYHPAAALHQPALRDTLFQDFGRILKAGEAAKPAPESRQGQAARQLSLF